MSTKNLVLALSVALALSATGCASLKGKQNDTAALEAAKAAQAAQDQATADAAAAEEARLSALKNKDGINASDLATDDTNSTNSTTNSSASSKDAKDAGAGITMADMLAVRLVHFDYDSSDLSSEDLQTLQAHAQYLSQNPKAKVLLAGHADERGTREYNMALGERRANAVLAFLNSNGVKSNQLDSVSYGKEKPLNDGHDDSAWSENRRVEINYQTGAPQ